MGGRGAKELAAASLEIAGGGRWEAFDRTEPSFATVGEAMDFGSDDPYEECFHGFRFARCRAGDIGGDPVVG